MYLYRTVDSRGQTIDFLLSVRRAVAAARRFFRKALNQPHTVDLHTITVDKNAAYPCAIKRMKKTGEVWRFAKLRQIKYLNLFGSHSPPLAAITRKEHQNTPPLGAGIV